MNDPKKGYVYRKLPIIVLLLLSLSLNAACSSPSESEANGTSGEEINLQWNIFGGETEISSLIPSDEDLLLAYNPPCARIREPHSGMVFTADNTGFASIQIGVSSDSGMANIEVYDGNTLIGSGPSPLVFNSPFAVGMHTITAKANGGCPSVPVTIIVNPSEPLVEIKMPANGQLFSTPADINIAANVQGPHKITKVEFFANSQKLGDGTGAGPSYSITWFNAEPGVYRLTAKATDKLGHAAISNYILVVVVPAKPLAKADLGLTMSSSPNPTVIGGKLNYVLTLTNFGPSRATNIVLTDFLPAGLDCYDSIATWGTYDRNTGEWDVGSLDPYRSARLTILTDVLASTNPGRIYNEATVAGAQRDDRTSNNYARINTLLIRRI